MPLTSDDTEKNMPSYIATIHSVVSSIPDRFFSTCKTLETFKSIRQESLEGLPDDPDNISINFMQGFSQEKKGFLLRCLKNDPRQVIENIILNPILAQDRKAGMIHGVLDLYDTTHDCTHPEEQQNSTPAAHLPTPQTSFNRSRQLASNGKTPVPHSEPGAADNAIVLDSDDAEPDETPGLPSTNLPPSQSLPVWIQQKTKPRPDGLPGRMFKDTAAQLRSPPNACRAELLNLPSTRIRDQWAFWEFATRLGLYLDRPTKIGREYTRAETNEIWNELRCFSCVWLSPSEMLAGSAREYYQDLGVESNPGRQRYPKNYIMTPIACPVCGEVHDCRIEWRIVLMIGSGHAGQAAVRQYSTATKDHPLGVSHLCGLPWCCNASHLRLETHVYNCGRKSCHRRQQQCTHNPPYIVEPFQTKNNCVYTLSVQSLR